MYSFATCRAKYVCSFHLIHEHFYIFRLDSIYFSLSNDLSVQLIVIDFYEW